jgi:tetratricopeptide (TPR) repeat protein
MDELLAVLARDRRATRRRIALLAGAVALAGAAVAVPIFSRGTSPGPRLCTGGPEQIAEAWGPPRRAALERGFSATGASYAVDSARAAARDLDRYAADWVKSWRDSCEATRVRGEQSATMQDLRAVCLARHRSELAALVDLLVRADAATMRRAVLAVEGLPPAAECDDLVALQAPVSPPPGAAARREVEAIREELARGDALLLAGQYKEGLSRIPALADRARATGYRPLQAEAEVLFGHLLSRSGDQNAAIEHFQAGLVAATAGRHDDVAARALTALVQSAADAEDFARGNDWVALGEAALERIGNPPRRRAALLHVQGYLLSRQGKFAEAAAEHEKALAIRQRIAPNSYETARSLNNVAFEYDEIGRYAEARALAERAVAIEIAELGPTHPEIATCYNNLGNIASDEGDLTRAADYYRRALAIREVAVKAGDDPGNLADVLNNLGIVALQQHRLDEALDFQRRALAVREKMDPEGQEISSSLTNIAAVELARGRTEEALATYRRALSAAERSVGRDHPFAGDALTGMGDCMWKLGQLAAAQSAFERALAIRKAGARPIELADTEFGLARTLAQRGDTRRAMELAKAARQRYAGDPAAREQLAELDAWLRSRRSR